MDHKLKVRHPSSSRPVISSAIVFGALLLVVLGCGKSTPPPAEYVGSWTGEDGSTMAIRADGSADYKSGGTTVSNGGIVVDAAAKTLKITFAGIGPSFTIDKPPSGDRMTLSGVVYKKGGGGSDSKPDKSTSDTKSDPSSLKAPSDDKVQRLVKDTLLDFNDAIQDDDFSDLLAKSSKPFKEQSSQEKMHDNFKGFIDAKINFAAVKNLTASFNKPPSVEHMNGLDVLIADGSFPTTPNKTKFVFKYVNEDGEWKLVGINVDTTKD